MKFGVVLAAALVLAPGAARAEWKKYDTAHFVIYSESGEKEVTRLAERLEGVDGLMRMASGLKSDVEPVKVRIYQVASNAEVERAINDPNSGVEGFYTTNVFGPSRSRRGTLMPRATSRRSWSSTTNMPTISCCNISRPCIRAGTPRAMPS